MTTLEQLAAARTALVSLEHFRTDFDTSLTTQKTVLANLKTSAGTPAQLGAAKNQVLGLEALLRDQDADIVAQREQIALLETAATQEAELADLQSKIADVQTLLAADKSAKIALLATWKANQAATAARIEQGTRLLIQAEQLFLRTESRAGRAIEPRLVRGKFGDAFPVADSLRSLDRIPAPPRLGGGVDLDVVVF